MASRSETVTYTIADVVKVFDMFAAEYDMAGQATGLASHEYVRSMVGDVASFAKKGYLERVSIVLTDSNGRQVRANQYVVSKDASAWNSSPPGNNLWPKTPGGALTIVVTLGSDWDDLTESAKLSFFGGLNNRWGPSDVNLSFPGLIGSSDRRFASNAYGLQKTVFKPL